MVLGGLVVIIVGVLVVNYFKDRGGLTLNGLNTQNTSTKEYVVAKGETLWSIAEDSYGSGYNWVDIKKENNLKVDTIEIGQKLVLPDVAAKQPTSTKVVVRTQSPADEIIGEDVYTVVRGDSLWKIAVRAYGDGFRWAEIAKANKLVHPNLIHSGNVLTLPR
jgi:nucleoid-associated protein YgaU